MTALLWAAGGTGFTFLMTTLGAAMVFLFRRRVSDLAQRILRQSQDLCQGEDDGTVLAVHLERSRDPLG